jgi:DNA-binding CsgD family transcriptional regulator
MSEGKRGRLAHDDVLTPAEWRVTELVRHGLTNARIASLLGVSPDAVKFHVASAILKLGLNGKAALKRWDGVARGGALHERKSSMTTTNLGPIGQIARTVKDIKAAARDLAARGAKITHAPHFIHKHEDGTEEWMCFFKDNEGRPLALKTQAKG